ncbi:MAG: preprotein translocase subunit SecG [Sulfurovaceae bacterium]|jgi:preprotein translocase subunit SecG
MASTFFVTQIILALILTVVVLLQKSSSIGLGAYSGSNESLFGAKGPMGFLSVLTLALAGLFIANTLALGYFYTKESGESVADMIPQNNKIIPATQPTETTPVTPEVPKTPESK